MEKLRNSLKIFLLTLCCFVLTFGLVACDLDIGGSGDDKKDDDASNDHTHVAVSEWSYDDKSHWHACEVEGCDEKVEKREHDLDKTAISENRVLYFCETCGYEDLVNVGSGDGEGESGGSSEGGSGGGGSQVGNGPDWWNTALSMDVTQCTQVVETLVNGNQTNVLYQIDVVENKIYVETTTAGQLIKGYYAKEGDNCYMYVYIAQLSTWQRYDLSQESFALYMSMAPQMEETFQELAEMYDEFTSVGDVWTIENATLSGEVVNRVTLEFENQELKKVVMFVEDETGTATTTVTFEPIEVVLPA